MKNNQIIYTDAVGILPDCVFIIVVIFIVEVLFQIFFRVRTCPLYSFALYLYIVYKYTKKQK